MIGSIKDPIMFDAVPGAHGAVGESMYPSVFYEADSGDTMVENLSGDLHEALKSVYPDIKLVSFTGTDRRRVIGRTLLAVVVLALLGILFL